ncbi:MAG TPA: hypothetical protein VG034_18605 [Acidimicrobiia bacterium]|jgi:hypothetical protein|nr:hypothetical protein [Acidimicrobiia bacterium]
MVDRIDLLIAVVAIVTSVLGSSTALWAALAKKPDREEFVQLRQDFHSLETKITADLKGLEAKVAADLNRVETKLDGLILRLVPEARS